MKKVSYLCRVLKNNNMKKLTTLTDQQLGVSYDLSIVNAIELSNMLKDAYTKRGISYKDYHHTNNWGNTKDVCHNESIYQYENFFIIKDGDDYLLLDGYRRLFVFDVPDREIKVMVYDRKDLSDIQILSLMIDLNNYKLVGSSGGAFYNRGFALMMKSLFDLDILNYKDYFDDYMTLAGREEKPFFSKSYEGSIISTKNVINNPRFLDDLILIDDLSKGDTPYLFSKFIDLLIEFRKTNKDFIIKSEDFIKVCNSNETIMNTLSKYIKSPQMTRHVSDLTKLYKSVLTELSTGLVEETIAEKIFKNKEIIRSIKKDKNFISITKKSNYGDIAKFLKSCYDKGEINKIKFKMVVEPLANEGRDSIKSGLYEGDLYAFVTNDSVRLIPTLFGLNVEGNPARIGIKHKSKSHGYYNSTISYNLTMNTNQDVTCFMTYDGLTGKALEELITIVGLDMTKL